MSGNVLDQLVIWSIFGLSVIEIIVILYVSQQNLIKIAKSQYVHKDHQIVYFVTFIMIALIFKLVILVSLQQIESSDIQPGKSITDLNCQVLLHTHVPQVFIVSAILIILIKSVIVNSNTQEKDLEFKQRQKRRLKCQSLIITLFQSATYILVLVRYFGSCNSNANDSTNGDDYFQFKVDYFIYSVLKILFLLLSVVFLFKIARQSVFLKPFKQGLITASLIMLLSIAKEVYGLIIISQTQAQVRDNIILIISLFYFDLILIGCLTYVALILKDVELEVLISIGIFKDIFEMSDREMFLEYEKLRKVSYKVKQKYKKYRQQLSEMEDDQLKQSRYSINDDDAINKKKAAPSGLGKFTKMTKR